MTAAAREAGTGLWARAINCLLKNTLSAGLAARSPRSALRVAEVQREKQAVLTALLFRRHVPAS